MVGIPAWAMNRGELARFQRNYIVDEQGCWTWSGPVTPNGYGKWKKSPTQPVRAAHRISFEHSVMREILPDMQLDHLCRNRKCINPAHLEEVTASENTRRQDHAGRRKTHCPQGHPYDDENTRVTGQGKRVCRACDKARKISASDVAGSG